MSQQQEETLSIKVWLLRKALQYVDALIINLLTGITFVGILRFAQQIWDLRLIPFSLLDAILLVGLAFLVALVLIALSLYFLVIHYLTKHPGLAMLLGIGLMAPYIIKWFSKLNLSKSDLTFEFKDQREPQDNGVQR